METPLLAADDDPPEPFLSPGSLLNDESEFSRLIAQSSAGPAENDNIALQLDLSTPTRCRGRPRSATTCDTQHTKRGSWIIIVASTFSILHFVLIWTSYICDRWTETHLILSVQLLQNTNSNLNATSDSVIQTIKLASLIQALFDAKAFVLLLIIWAASIFLPCTFMICTPVWVMTDYQRPVRWEARAQMFNARAALELFIRLGFAVLFVFVVLDLAISILRFEWSDTEIQVQSRTVTGLATFVLGVTCAVAAVLVFRALPQKILIGGHDGHVQMTAAAHPPLVRSPPPNAFRFPPLLPEIQVDDDNIENPAILPLEEAPEPIILPEPSGTSTPELVDEDTSVAAPMNALSLNRRILVFQTGLFSVLLLCPSFYIPILSFSYSGLAAALLTESSLDLLLWQFPLFLWKEGLSFDRDFLTMALFSGVLVLSLIIVPVMATCLGILTWLGDGAWSTNSRYLLYCIQPALGGVVFSITLFVMLDATDDSDNHGHSLNMLVLNGISSSLCEKFAQAMGDNCLLLTGRLLPGAWFYMIQSIALEIFVMLTLRWSRFG